MVWRGMRRHFRGRRQSKAGVISQNRTCGEPRRTALSPWWARIMNPKGASGMICGHIGSFGAELRLAPAAPLMEECPMTQYLGCFAPIMLHSVRVNALTPPFPDDALVFRPLPGPGGRSSAVEGSPGHGFAVGAPAGLESGTGEPCGRRCSPGPRPPPRSRRPRGASSSWT